MRTPARSPEDIIGIVPHTLGYTPRNSLVALIVGTDDSGAQSSSTTLRIDFSRETAARIIAEGGDWYVDLVLRAGTVSGVFLILYDEDYEHIDPFADEATGPFADEATGPFADEATGPFGAEAQRRPRTVPSRVPRRMRGTPGRTGRRPRRQAMRMPNTRTSTAASSTRRSTNWPRRSRPSASTHSAPGG